MNNDTLLAGIGLLLAAVYFIIMFLLENKGFNKKKLLQIGTTIFATVFAVIIIAFNRNILSFAESIVIVAIMVGFSNLYISSVNAIRTKRLEKKIK